MSCEFARLVVWTLRSWFASDRSLAALARVELAWIERDLATQWPRFALFLSVLDFERLRDPELHAPTPTPTPASSRTPGPLSASRADAAGRPAHPPLTSDEAAVLAALTCARWSTSDAALCLAGLLNADSAAAAARIASRLGAPAAREASPFVPRHEDPMMKLTMHAAPTPARTTAPRALGASVALAFAFAAPAAFAGPQCTQADRAQWQDQAKFQEQLKAQGYRIKVFKVTDGNCYEIYGWDKQNRKVEIYFDPVSGKAMKTEIG